AENRLTIRDGSGAPLANAEVEIFQSTLDRYEEWYATDYDDVPDLTLRTDANGQVLVGRCPFSEDGVVVNFWRGSNTVAIMRVNHALYGFLESAAFNMEYWRGHTELGEVDVVVSDRGDVCGVAGPTILDAKEDDGAVTLSWAGVDGATLYRVMAAADGGAPRTAIATAKTSATVRLAGGVYLWIEAERAGCPSVRSSTWHVFVTPTRRRAVS
ncbi:MAG TPA: hypothetical protein VEO74_10490, partial [Thermoanaerobaculia bacterium]|nr:hypothetical protein [Thermoanaerobaculia bacterium]